jgi:hypothetical protein
MAADDKVSVHNATPTEIEKNKTAVSDESLSNKYVENPQDSTGVTFQQVMAVIVRLDISLI